MKNEYKDTIFKDKLKKLLEPLYPLGKRKDIILVGGYKGQLHSILLKADRLDKKPRENRKKGCGIFLECEKKLPHGHVSVQYEREIEIL